MSLHYEDDDLGNDEGSENDLDDYEFKGLNSQGFEDSAFSEHKLIIKKGFDY